MSDEACIIGTPITQAILKLLSKAPWRIWAQTLIRSFWILGGEVGPPVSSHLEVARLLYA